MLGRGALRQLAGDGGRLLRTPGALLPPPPACRSRGPVCFCAVIAGLRGRFLPRPCAPGAAPAGDQGAQPRAWPTAGAQPPSLGGVGGGDRATAQGGVTRPAQDLPLEPGLPLGAATRVPAGGGAGWRVTRAAARGPGVCCLGQVRGPPHARGHPLSGSGLFSASRTGWAAAAVSRGDVPEGAPGRRASPAQLRQPEEGHAGLATWKLSFRPGGSMCPSKKWDCAIYRRGSTLQTWTQVARFIHFLRFPLPLGSPKGWSKQAATHHAPVSLRPGGRTQCRVPWGLQAPEKPPRGAVAGPGHVTPAGHPAPGGGERREQVRMRTSLSIFFLVGLDATTVSSSPSFSDFILPDIHCLSPAHWLRQADRPTSQSRRCVQGPARGTGRIGPMGALGAGAPQPGRGDGDEGAALPQSACGRGRAGTSSRRGVDGGGDNVASQSSGWARRRWPGSAEGSVVCGGGPSGGRGAMGRR